MTARAVAWTVVSGPTNTRSTRTWTSTMACEVPGSHSQLRSVAPLREA